MQWRQDTAEVFTLQGKGGLPVIGELLSGGLISYQGNQQRGMLLTASLIRTTTSWGLRQALRKVDPVRRV